jgi:integrase
MTYYGSDGKQRWDSCHTQNKTEAQALLDQRRVAVREGQLPEVKRFKTVLFTELAEDYKLWAEKQKNYKNKKYIIDKLSVTFGSLNLDQFTTQLVEQCQSEQLKKGGKPATVNRYLATLKHMFTKAVEWEMVPERIREKVRRVKFLQENNQRLRFLSQEEMANLIQACGEHVRPIVITALNTGMRRNEILSLKWEQVDLKHGFIFLYDTKNGEKREIPINNPLRETLSALTHHIISPYVFWRGEDGRRYKEVKKSFQTALRKAEINDFRFHDLRHTFASQLVMAGADLVTVKELLGHKTLDMTLRYSHLAPSHKVKAVSLLEPLHDKNMTIEEKKHPAVMLSA